MTYYERALELREEIIQNRRYLHQNAEVGLDLPKTRDYVLEKLKEYGLEPQVCGHGVTARLGGGNKCILLRADMDALPMGEDSGESFACATGTEAHTCGHDLHAAMLLTAAKMLKEREGELKGTVKFMFQSAEETFEGANDMVANGILEDPRPDAALAFHVAAGNQAPGMFFYNNSGAMMFSVDGFYITIHGRGAHGAYPHFSVDPVNIAVHVYLALQAILAREVDPQKACIMTVGAFNAGSAPNIIPNEAVLQGTIRCNDQHNRLLMKRRLQEVAEKTAEAYGGRAEVQWISQVPPLVCQPELVNALTGYLDEPEIPGMVGIGGVVASASEDFAVIASQIPACFMNLSAGFPELENPAPAHNPKVRFNEDVLPLGAACYAHCAQRWLESQK